MAYFSFMSTILFALVTKTAYGIRCTECSDLANPRDCGAVTECSAGDVCYVQEHITYGGIVLYNTGCMSSIRCASIKRGIIDVSGTRKARTGDIITCVECCNGDFCNVDGCGQTAVQQSQRGPLCYDCKNQNGPDHCRAVVECDKGGLCILSKPHPYDTFWRSGCATHTQCDMLKDLVKATNNTELCATCCSGDFCNNHCGWPIN